MLGIGVSIILDNYTNYCYYLIVLKLDNIMKAVIKTGGKQYQVSQGDVIKIEKLANQDGDKLVFDQVLLLVDNDKISLGAPYLDKVKVEGTLVKNFKEKKLDVFKYKNKTRYRRKIGHRHQKSEVKIDKIIV